MKQVDRLDVHSGSPKGRAVMMIMTPLVAGLAVRVIEVYRWQVLDVLLGDAEPDAVTCLRDRADRDGHLPAPPQVPLLEQHMGDVAAAAIDDEALNLADVAVSGMHVLAAAYGHLAQRDRVIGDLLREG